MASTLSWEALQATMDPLAGEQHGETTVEVASVAGAPSLIATDFIPQGVELAGIGYHVLTSFSGEQGLVWIACGGLGVTTRWGSVLGLVAGDVNTPGQWVGGRVNMAAPGSVVLLPNPAGARFGVTGVVRLTCFFTRFIPL